MNYRPTEPQDRLAADYVLGTMRGAARRRMEQLMAADATMRRAVRDWEERIVPLAEAMPPVEPPRRLWKRIEQQIRASRPEMTPWWNRLLTWKLASAGLMASLVLTLGLLWQAPAPNTGGRYVAVLAGQDQQPTLVAYASRTAHTLEVKLLRGQPPKDTQAFELWAIPRNGKPVSLGVLAHAQKSVLKLAGAADVALGDIPTLAVSLEPRGGSPTGQPTGPVLFSGPCIKMW